MATERKVNRDEAVALHHAGWTNIKIAAHFGVAPVSIHRHLKAAGVPKRPKGRQAHHFIPTEHFLEVFDGLMLRDAGLKLNGNMKNAYLVLAQSMDHAPWVDIIAEEIRSAGVTARVTNYDARAANLQDVRELRTLSYHEFTAQHRRWYVQKNSGKGWRKIVPEDVRLTPVSIAHWLNGDGANSGKYTVKFCTNGFTPDDIDILINKLRTSFGWEGAMFWVTHGGKRYPMLRFSRSSDRVAIRQMIIDLVPECLRHRIDVIESAPCSDEEETRRRNPFVFTTETAEKVRAEIATGKTYSEIAEAYDVHRSIIGKIARHEAWADGTAPVVRRRADRSLFSDEEQKEILCRSAAGESQVKIAQALGRSQPGVSSFLARMRRQGS